MVFTEGGFDPGACTLLLPRTHVGSVRAWHAPRAAGPPPPRSGSRHVADRALPSMPGVRVGRSLPDQRLGRSVGFDEPITCLAQEDKLKG